MAEDPGFFAKGRFVPEADRRKHHRELHKPFYWTTALLQSLEQIRSEPSHVSGLLHTVQDRWVSKLKPDGEFGPQFNRSSYINTPSHSSQSLWELVLPLVQAHVLPKIPSQEHSAGPVVVGDSCTGRLVQHCGWEGHVQQL